MISTYHYTNWFSKDYCEKLVAYALESYQPHKAKVMSGATSVDHEMRECEIRWLKPTDDKLRELIARINHLYTDAQINAFGMRDMFGMKELQFTTYRGSNEGHYDFHVDSGTNCRCADRRLSMVLLLSDPSEYEGGQFEMKPRLLPECLSKQGDVLFFRSEILHRVLPVTAGVRHSLVTWFYGTRN